MLTSRAAILALVMCVIALSLAYPLREYIAQRAQIAELQEEHARMERDVRELRQRKEELSQDSYVEREARLRLHYQYPGETTYIVISPDSEDDTEDDTGPSEPWFTTLWRSVEEADSPPPDDGGL
ncbi:FtsB family cell division protein [Nocardiopsis halotolerans]|uniref:FtsB family cell division protein n=1 Tax=Nocardiopsis halotolerans TaxID=124252 RepID=UPI000347E9BB|nr:septum formation initiator family protein [Nocardiopsis halotolerans]